MLDAIRAADEGTSRSSSDSGDDGKRLRAAADSR